MSGLRYVIVAAALSGAPAGAQNGNPLMSALRESYNTMKRYLIASGEMLPESQYVFKLTPVSRTFGDWMKHTAEMNYGTCATLLRQAKPEMKAIEAAITKDQILQVLRDSFEYCDTAFREATDRTVLVEIASGERRLYPVAEFIGYTNSLHEHYGNLIGYLRSNNVTPPSTLRTQRVLK